MRITTTLIISVLSCHAFASSMQTEKPVLSFKQLYKKKYVEAKQKEQELKQKELKAQLSAQRFASMLFLRKTNTDKTVLSNRMEYYFSK